MIADLGKPIGEGFSGRFTVVGYVPSDDDGLHALGETYAAVNTAILELATDPVRCDLTATLDEDFAEQHTTANNLNRHEQRELRESPSPFSSGRYARGRASRCHRCPGPRHVRTRTLDHTPFRRANRDGRQA